MRGVGLNIGQDELNYPSTEVEGEIFFSEDRSPTYSTNKSSPAIKIIHLCLEVIPNPRYKTVEWGEKHYPSKSINMVQYCLLLIMKYGNI